MTIGDAPDSSTLAVLQDMVAAIHQHAEETASLTEALLDDQRQARLEADRRFDKQTRKLRVQAWATAFVIALLAWVIIQADRESDQRDDRSRIAEAQRRCAATVQNVTLARLSTLAIATQNRVAGTSTVDPGAMARLRDDVALSASQTIPDPDLLAKIRDEVAAILATVQPDSPENRRLRDDVARANDALLRVSEICFTDRPAENPLDR